MWMIVVGGACDGGEPGAQWRAAVETGTYGVGFRTMEATRVAADGSRRDLTLSVWYPATTGGQFSNRVTVEDLFRIVLDEAQLTETDGLPIEPAFAAAMTGVPTSLPVDRSRRALDEATHAIWDAAPVAGRFPLVLWSVRHATTLAQAPMSERLASNGAVVVSVWSSDPPLAFLWEDRSEADKLLTIEAQTQDLQHTLEVLRQDSTIDTGRVVVLAWSYGGQSAARLQARESSVRAVVGLDANVLPTPEAQVQYRRPLVYLTGQGSSANVESLSGLEVPWVSVRLPAMAHGNFNALEGFLPELYGADTVFAWSQSGAVARVGYQILTQMVSDAVSVLGSESPGRFSDLAEQLRQHGDSVSVELREAPNGH